MLLSELRTGEKAVIVKVSGYGAFRKRIIEMGFIQGTEIEVILNAPLKDPVKYRIMNFEVSLRRKDAENIEVVSLEEAKQSIFNNKEQAKDISIDEALPNLDTTQTMHSLAQQKSKIINVALVGNPNCGKTSIFNIAANAHEHVGNYSGVTVDEKQGKFVFNGYTFLLTDLPGTYSLSAYSPEELYVRKHIMEKKPDIILNVLDSSNLERNLYLTMQLVDMDLRLVIALNMFDELKRSGDNLDYEQFSKLLGCPMIPTKARNGEGVKELFQKIIDVYEGKDNFTHHIHVNHGDEIEKGIKQLRNSLNEHGYIDDMSSRFLAIKLLENDSQMEQRIKEQDKDGDILLQRNEIRDKYQKEFKSDLEGAITDAKYGFIRGALKEVYQKSKQKNINKSKKFIKLTKNILTKK